MAEKVVSKNKKQSKDPQRYEEDFKKMIETQRRHSVSMNSQNLISSQLKIKEELLCALCSGILFNPIRCKACKKHYHRACLKKFCKETRQCPMLCEKPRFVSIEKEIQKLTKDLKFSCVNQVLGCEKVLGYQDVLSHGQNCEYTAIKCEAYSDCKTKCIKKDINSHLLICPYIKTPCVFCMKEVRRIDMTSHQDTECEGVHTCQSC